MLEDISANMVASIFRVRKKQSRGTPSNHSMRATIGPKVTSGSDDSIVGYEVNAIGWSKYPHLRLFRLIEVDKKI
jgi:hypothetical protein